MSGLVPLLMAAFLATYTFSSTNVALPYISADLGASDAELELIMATYGATFALLLITGGRLGDRFGRRRLFGIGLAAFVVTTAYAGAAPTIELLLLLRGAQGLSAGLLVPQILASIQASSLGAERARNVALFSAAGGMGTASGQIIGGALIGADIGGSGWRSVLWAAAVIGLIAALFVRRVPDTASSDPARADLAGAAVLAAAIVCFLLPVTLGPSLGWPWWLITMLVACPVLFVVFWRYERWLGSRTTSSGSRRTPLVPPEVISIPAMRRGLIMCLLFFAGFGAFMYLFAVISQSEWGYTAFESGLTLVGFAVAFAIVSLSMRKVQRWTRGRPLIVGGILQSVLVTILALVIGLPDGPPPVWELQVVLIAIGGVQALMFAPLVGEVMHNIPSYAAGLSGGLFGTSQQAALALGVAVYGGIFNVVREHFGWSMAHTFMLTSALQVLSGIAFAWLAVRLGSDRSAPIEAPAQ